MCIYSAFSFIVILYSNRIEQKALQNAVYNLNN